jgi:general secretion pathway protein A
MYEEFYGFSEEPFRLSPDSRICFGHPSYKKAKAYMQYALHRGEGFVMVTGQPGTGKSTLISDLTTDLSDSNVVVSKLACTQLQADDLLRLVVLHFGLDGQVEHKALLLHNLSDYLQRLHREGKRPLLIIDEAQDLSTTALEELRLLTNLQHNNHPMLQIFLVGQEGLRDMVLSPQLEQLHQRIIAACHLEPLNADATIGYIKFRLRKFGWKEDPVFDHGIFPYIHKYSQGIPRLVNMICSRMLLHGMVEELHKLDVDDIRSVIDGLSQEQLLPNATSSELPEVKPDPVAPPHSHTAEVINYPGGQETQAAIQTPHIEPEPVAHSESAPSTITQTQQQQMEIAIRLYTKLLRLLDGKPQEALLEVYLNFMDGQVINGARLSLPYISLAAMGHAGFGNWLKSTRNGLRSDVREVLILVYGLMQSDMQIE